MHLYIKYPPVPGEERCIEAGVHVEVDAPATVKQRFTTRKSRLAYDGAPAPNPLNFALHFEP